MKNNQRSSIPIIYLIGLFFILGCTSSDHKGQINTIQSAENTNKNLTPQKVTTSNNYSGNINNSALQIKYPNVIKVDTIRNLYTYEFQELLEKYSNMILFENGRIRDIEINAENHIVTIQYRYQIQAKLIVTPSVWKEFKKNITSRFAIMRGSFIVKITSITPVNSEFITTVEDLPIVENTSDINLTDYVSVELATSPRPVYLLQGILIDFVFN